MVGDHHNHQGRFIKIGMPESQEIPIQYFWDRAPGVHSVQGPQVMHTCSHSQESWFQWQKSIVLCDLFSYTEQGTEKGNVI